MARYTAKDRAADRAFYAAKAGTKRSRKRIPFNPYSTQEKLNYYRRKYFALLKEHKALLRELR